MCYICRKEISSESYKHFCDHFRPILGQSCTSCTKCELYKTPQEDSVIQNAANEARKRYMLENPDVPNALKDHADTSKLRINNFRPRIKALDGHVSHYQT